MNKTIEKFGYPQSLIREYNHWVVLLRPKQITAGSLILACKENVQSLSQVSPEAYKEFPIVASEIEKALKKSFSMTKINYLALMMVDKEVHFHIIPRYSESIPLNGIVLKDKDWPGPPDITNYYDLTFTQLKSIQEKIIKNW